MANRSIGAITIGNSALPMASRSIGAITIGNSALPMASRSIGAITEELVRNLEVIAVLYSAIHVLETTLPIV